MGDSARQLMQDAPDGLLDWMAECGLLNSEGNPVGNWHKKQSAE